MSDFTKEQLSPEEIERRRRLKEKSRANWNRDSEDPNVQKDNQSKFLKGSGWLDNIRKQYDSNGK